MTEIPRRTIPELQARYMVEPGIRDVFVEGYFDVDLVRWFLDAIQVRGVEVYEIDTVEVPSDLSDGIPPQGGSRTRVIRLANALRDSVSPGQVACIVDADFDRIAQRLEKDWQQWNLSTLLYTDVTAMEMYLFSTICTSKVVRLVAQEREVDIGAILTDTGRVLRQVFAVRYANYVGGFHFQWIDCIGCCSRGRSYVEFNQEEFNLRAS